MPGKYESPTHLLGNNTVLMCTSFHKVNYFLCFEYRFGSEFFLKSDLDVLVSKTVPG